MMFFFTKKNIMVITKTYILWTEKTMKHMVMQQSSDQMHSSNSVDKWLKRQN